MNRFDRAELVAFLRAIDRNLDEKIVIVIVGGAAAAVGYDSNVKTADIDVFALRAGSAQALARAADAARRETALGVSVGPAPVAELPENYESRLKPVRGLKLHNLTLIVPDKYDIALSKALRGYPHDIDAIESMHTHHPLSSKTLVRRFETELMKTATADPREIALSMAMVVARLHGFEEGRKLAVRWNVPVPAGRSR